MVVVCSLREKKKKTRENLFLLQADDDNDVFCFLCFRLAVTNIVDDFSSFPLLCFQSITCFAFPYLNDTAVCVCVYV